MSKNKKAKKIIKVAKEGKADDLIFKTYYVEDNSLMILPGEFNIKEIYGTIDTIEYIPGIFEDKVNIYLHINKISDRHCFNRIDIILDEEVIYTNMMDAFEIITKDRYKTSIILEINIGKVLSNENQIY